MFLFKVNIIGLLYMKYMLCVCLYNLTSWKPRYSLYEDSRAKDTNEQWHVAGGLTVLGLCIAIAEGPEYKLVPFYTQPGVSQVWDS